MDSSTKMKAPTTAEAVVQASADAVPRRVDGASLASARSPRRTVWVTLPDETEVQIAAPRPLEVAWLAQQCMEEVPDLDSKTPGATKRQWNGLKRGFYQVAIALREVDGKRSYPGTLNDPGAWHVGADQVSVMDNDAYEAILTAYVELTDSTKARAEMGKGSGKTPTSSA